jgi:hypothetical protein
MSRHAQLLTAPPAAQKLPCKEDSLPNSGTSGPPFGQPPLPQMVELGLRPVPEHNPIGGNPAMLSTAFPTPEATVTYMQSSGYSAYGTPVSLSSYPAMVSTPVLSDFYMTLPVDVQAEHGAICDRIEQLVQYYTYLSTTMPVECFTPQCPPWFHPRLGNHDVVGNYGRRPESYLEFLNMINNHRVWYEREVARLEGLRVIWNNLDYAQVYAGVTRNVRSVSMGGPLAQVWNS